MKIRTYLKPYLHWVILAPLLMFLEVFMDLQQPSLMAHVVDDGVLADGDGLSIIIKTSLKMLFFAILGVIGGMGCTYFSSKASQNFGADLRADLFRKVQSFSFAETDRFSTGSLVTRLTNDVTQVQNFVMMAMRMFVRTPLLCIGGIIMAVSINSKFALIMAIAMPLLIAVIAVILSVANPIFSKMQKKLDKLNAVMQENLMGARVVKAYVKEQDEIDEFKAANKDLTDTALFVTRLMTIMSPIMTLVMNASVLAVIYIGGLEIEAAHMDVGSVMAVVTYMTQVLMSLTMMSMMFMVISRAKASMDRLREVMETQPSITSDGADPSLTVTRGEIEFKNVSFRYPGMAGDPVLHDINLSVHAGETVAFLGSTGSGKTSLINLIPRFYDATEGEVLVDGVNVKDYHVQTLRSKIGIVLQSAVLFSGTIEENLRWGKEDATAEEIRTATDIAQASEYIDRFQDRDQTVLGQGGLSLSGGQKQRLSIARALLRQPKILIMDDSTSALDMGTEARLQNALRKTMQNMTVLLIAQRVSSVMHADKIVVLDKGGIAAIGTHEELLRTSDIYRDIYESQVGEGGSMEDVG